MSRVPRFNPAATFLSTRGEPPNPQILALAQQSNAIIETVDENIEFGEPQNPADPTDTAQLAGATGAGSHNGTISNIKGSWVEALITSAGRSTITCNHNLYLSNPDYTVPAAGQPNCRWLVFGWMHDGTGAGPTTELMLNVWFGGGTVSANSIDLEVSVDVHAGAATVEAGSPIRLTLFFTQATRGE